MMYPVLVGRPTCIGIMYQCNMYDLNVPFHNSVSAVFRVQGNYRSLPLLNLLLWLVFVYIRNRLPNSYHEKKSSHMVYYTISFQIFGSYLLHQHSSYCSVPIVFSFDTLLIFMKIFSLLMFKGMAKDVLDFC